ncbi:MAG: ribonuclease E/G, partial [Erythrobacter sp.]
GAEDQLRAMYDPMVQLKSGGYLIINPTEALVSIDINSGRSTKEHGIEATALHTNLEAAKEIARQLRLRDMAGIVVIDFIDMEYPSNFRKVEKAMKEALKNDRARIQVGRISSFGLMEMSRQRLRTGVLEATTRPCPHCDGTGLVRTASSAGLSALRLIEDEAAKGKGTIIRLAASTEAAIYLLNEKRADLVEIEQRYGVSVAVVPEGEDEGAKMSVSSSGPRPLAAPKFEPIVDDDDDLDLSDEDEDDIEEEAEAREPRQRGRDRERGDEGDGNDEGGGRKKKRRRRRGGRNRNRDREEGSEGDEAEDRMEDDAGGDGNAEDAGEAALRDDSETADSEGRPKKRRRRGGRGRKRRENGEGAEGDVQGSDEDMSGEEDAAETPAEPEAEAPAPAPEAEPIAEETPAEKPKRVRAPRKKKEAAPVAAEEASAELAPELAAVSADTASAEEEAPAEKPKRKRTPRKAKAAAANPVEVLSEQVVADMAVVAGPDEAPQSVEALAAESAPAAAQADSAATPPPEAEAKPRRGWWQRTFGE